MTTYNDYLGQPTEVDTFIQNVGDAKEVGKKTITLSVRLLDEVVDHLIRLQEAEDERYWAGTGDVIRVAIAEVWELIAQKRDASGDSPGVRRALAIAETYRS